MPPKQPPLPVASNHAAISNRISMLLSAQSSLLKTLNPSSSSSKRPAPTKNSSLHDQDKDDQDLFKNNARPNEGVGYTAPSSSGTTQSAHDRRKEDQALRSRMMGRQADGKGKRGKGRSLMKKAEESESEEEMGRSALGKRKRARRESPVKTEMDDKIGERGDEVGEEENKEAEEGNEHTQKDETKQQKGIANESATQKKRKRNKKKSKSNNRQTSAEAS